ncbi:hypothetical protein [Arthrobacter sp. ISL-5]|uniref:hypothetical protein n=1 Tax=Arthrobacter sp. ISL-5 TaxID=2819111 RepID=UPI001BE508D3|nr:hypothetical protein [Arthrobacter sp. ISL-5]MBT2553514.1 hypothetical protein [Arthrobacter sp. ISL-5]
MDYVTVDDTGDFGHRWSERELLAAFEYAGEARSIIDRKGNDYGLVMDPDRRLILGPALGPVEFHWLSQAWQAAQNVHVERHRLRRFHPGTRDQLLQDLFEVLVLEHAADTGPRSWSLDVGGVTTRLRNLQEIDCRSPVKSGWSAPACGTPSGAPTGRYYTAGTGTCRLRQG